MGLRPNDPRSPYVQIADDLREAIRSGDYEPGAKLPPTRELREQYGVAPMTVQRALEILRGENLVYGVQGRGTFVRSDIDPAAITDGSSSDFVTVMRRLDEIADEIRQLDRRVATIEKTRRTRPKK